MLMHLPLKGISTNFLNSAMISIKNYATRETKFLDDSAGHIRQIQQIETVISKSANSFFQ